MQTFNTKKVGWVGLGQMGSPMVGHLLHAGFEVEVYNRSPEKAQAVVEKGALLAPNVETVAQNNDVLFLMVSDYPAIESLLTLAVLAALKGKVVVNMSTVSPTQNQLIETQLKSHQVHFIEAPVSGSSKVAEAGKLLVLGAGDKAIFDQLVPLFNAFSSKVYHYGEVGKAGGVKLAVNALLGIFNEAYAEALVFAEQFGINQADIIDTIANGAMNSPMFQSKIAMYESGEFPPVFMLKHITKDLNLAVDELEKANKRSPLIEKAAKTFSEANQTALSQQDLASIYTYLKK
ncbi:NADP oxidoreductase coenzyme F420-dependent [Haemophilus sputorum HK 2154]|uniref:NAD(P)-dependent oxidoreductase n=1 Tax=Haemophilus sputorum TaxID=1078480 RepID=UPI0002489CA8|nr:NAD(P)-dependent oxidoreductase [Haemophilus sputorum]EJP28414.1 NADP oxidoreductase coenzyme F420-dependent [Haemophilus sputorum HK 2154]